MSSYLLFLEVGGRRRIMMHADCKANVGVVHEHIGEILVMCAYEFRDRSCCVRVTTSMEKS
jgi:hypothetical protein